MRELVIRFSVSILLASALAGNVCAQSEQLSLEELKAAAAKESNYRNWSAPAKPTKAPAANLAEFKQHIQPLLRKACVSCHGPDEQEGDFRVDTLNPDLVHGDDAAWWIEVFDAISKGEMPPQDEVELPPAGRSRIIEWLSTELQVASQVARSEQGHSSFRRMTRYEFNYALQDLLGLPYDFAKDLPPETVSEDGFLNSSEMLQMTATQFETYRELARQALLKATVRGEQPKPVYYAITMDVGFEKERQKYEADLQKLRKRFANDPDKLKKELAKRKSRKSGGAHYRNLETGFTAGARWSYGGARYARKPTASKPEVPPALPDVAVIPVNQSLIIDLGDHLPDSGTLRLRIRASAKADNEKWVPSLRVFFGHQASNNSRADERVGNEDFVIDRSAPPKFYDVEIPLSEIVRNPFRGIQKLGQTPNPAEYVMLRNTSGVPVDIQFDYVEITAPYYSSWPPQSHRRVFGDSKATGDEIAHAREVLAQFMKRAWRRPSTEKELQQKLALFAKLRPQCVDAQEALIEVLAGVLASPKFLYLPQGDEAADDYQLATRLAMFLWASVPDQQLLDMAAAGKLSDPSELAGQTDRMLQDPKARRFAQHFVRQWLGMQLMDHLQMDRELRDAMHEEPIAFFKELIRNDSSVMDFLHADYTMVNAKLAQHYGLRDVYGADFRRAKLSPSHRRGGLLTQAGLLAMNSDGKDSHPLKRGIWLLESILNDPPPPPPPAVPEIDLSDPEILKLTLKERMEDHRNDPACMSCHQRIDPWGIAFENFDALGRWRTTVGKKPVDANSLLFNKQELRGTDGLKRYLLTNRQDQFARAITHKLTTYALGRPLSFADRAEVDKITAQLRQEGDGLRTLIKLIVTSELFSPSKKEESQVTGA